jgi:hypothetical protein
MKRTLLVFVVVGVASLLVSALTVFGQSSPRSIYVERQVTDPLVKRQAAATSAKSSTDDEKLIDELTMILKETKSPETFLVTAMTLGRLGPKARRTLPVVIRNAERLELLEGLFDTNASSEDHAVAQDVIEVIDMIIGKNGGGRVWREKQPTTPPVCYPASPASYYVPSPVPVSPNPGVPEMDMGSYSAPAPSSLAPAAPTPVSTALPAPTIESAPRPPSPPSQSTMRAEERLAPVPSIAR